MPRVSNRVPGDDAFAGGFGDERAEGLVKPGNLARFDERAAVVEKSAHRAGVGGAEAGAVRRRPIQTGLWARGARGSSSPGKAGAGQIERKPFPIVGRAGGEAQPIEERQLIVAVKAVNRSKSVCQHLADPEAGGRLGGRQMLPERWPCECFRPDNAPPTITRWESVWKMCCNSSELSSVVRAGGDGVIERGKRPRQQWGRTVTRDRSRCRCPGGCDR